MSELTLPPQTTPFTPSPDVDCTMSVLCEDLTYSNYADGSQSLSGMPCQALNKLGRRELGTQTACFPEGYISLFAPLTSEIYTGTDSGIPSVTKSPESLTLAYPGSACISGWTTACTTTVAAEGSEYPQAWCCPPGSWTCATEQPRVAGVSREDPGEGAATGRYCASAMTEPSEIWMSWDPPVTLSDDGSYKSWTASVTAEPLESAATVFHPVFPLQLTANNGIDGRGEQVTDSPPTRKSGGHKREDYMTYGSNPNLSTPAIIGVVIFSTVFLLAMIGIAFIVRHRYNRGGDGGGRSGQDIELRSHRPQYSSGEARHYGDYHHHHSSHHTDGGSHAASAFAGGAMPTTC
ncbi:hypothetical protein GGS26DRAFT_590119 [Hypomontagnella submonticulosa]|nr:hypothetical protein GGS26DRAFT_590119 [Hypomontagnella submonticulosa]